jgi:hypothetical protein
MAPEYPESAIREGQRPNGSTDPQTADYLAVKQNDFADYRLQVTGLVDKPLSLSLDELRTMPSRRSRGTIASKVGAASPNGQACSCLRATSSSAATIRWRTP